MMLWMGYTLLAAAMLAGAALAMEEAARLLDKPRRWGWLAAMSATVLLPPLYRLLPAESAPKSAATVDSELVKTWLAQASASEVSQSALDHILFGKAADLLLLNVWAVSALAMGAALLLTWRRLARLRSGGRAVEIAGVPALLTDSTGPMVVGVRRPEVVVPRWIETLSEEEQRLVIRHESEHARAGDPRLLLAAAVLLAAMPWNVPLWWMRRRLRQAIEVDCDARVLSTGADRRLYGSMLIRTAGRPRPTPLLAPALVELPSLLERRIIAMTAKSPRHRAARLALAVPLGALLFAAACELTPRATSPAPTEPTLAEVLDADDVAIEEPSRDSGEAGARLHAEAVVLRHDQVEVSANGTKLRADTVRIRLSPLAAGSANPIVLVDGQRVEGIAGVDPSRIATIEVLKGAAATSRFGEDGKDGAVLVTTRARGTPRTIGPAPVVPATGAADETPRVRAPIPGVLEGVVAVGYGVPRAVRAVTPISEGVVALGHGAAPRAEASAAVALPGRASVVPTPLRGEPLILVDNEIVPTMADVMSRFDADDIASISVLKDREAAVAEYGARARHGAIIIRLKEK